MGLEYVLGLRESCWFCYCCREPFVRCGILNRGVV